MKEQKTISAITAGEFLFHSRVDLCFDLISYTFSSRFSQYNNLKRHVNSVHKSLRINCLIPGCNYSVARKDKYKNHLASQHKFLDDKTKESIMKTVKFE
jgi:hypothetical protein